MPRYRLDLRYDGSDFHGWQIQNNAPSVQDTLQKALSILLREPCEIVGCGRTDTGVHAQFYVAHFDSLALKSENFGQFGSLDQLTYRLNNLLPESIYIIDCIEVSEEFHARFTATKRGYKYFLETSKNPFNSKYSWLYPHELDLNAMNQAASLMLGRHNFQSFCKGETPNNSYDCEVFTAEWQKVEATGLGSEQIVFHIEANRFLRNMVRATVGTLLLVGRHKITLEEFQRILDAKNRSDAGNSVPAKGLFLWSVEY